MSEPRTLQQIFHQYISQNSARFSRTPRIRCMDGTHLSVQVGAGMYCTPREGKGPWTHVEVGYPSVKPPARWEEFAEDWSEPTSTVYAYVPLSEVELFIASHGGIDYQASGL